jgi:hypothetical protein
MSNFHESPKNGQHFNTDKKFDHQGAHLQHFFRNSQMLRESWSVWSQGNIFTLV